MVLPRWLSGKESACQRRRCGFDPWVEKIPWRRKWQPTPVFLPGKSHGQRRLASYRQWGHKESDTTEQLTPQWEIPNANPAMVIFPPAKTWQPSLSSPSQVYNTKQINKSTNQSAVNIQDSALHYLPTHSSSLSPPIIPTATTTHSPRHQRLQILLPHHCPLLPLPLRWPASSLQS